MRIFIISCVFPPEALTTASTSADVAEEMVRRGHEVIVLAPFPNRPSGCLMDGYARKWRQIEYKNGYKLVHTWHTLSERSNFFFKDIREHIFWFNLNLANTEGEIAGYRLYEHLAFVFSKFELLVS